VIDNRILEQDGSEGRDKQEKDGKLESQAEPQGLQRIGRGARCICLRRPRGGP
jgi:hypothetical protein